MAVRGEARLFAHLPAASGASPTDLRAFRHFGVGHRLAGIGTRLADCRAGGTDQRMQLRIARHEIGAGLAHLNAVHHQSHMAGLGVMAALLDAVMQRWVGVRMHGGLRGVRDLTAACGEGSTGEEAGRATWKFWREAAAKDFEMPKMGGYVP